MVKRKRLLASDKRDYSAMKKLKQYAAGAAGGALGFIVDNVPGAIAGAEMAYNFVGDGTDGLPEKNKMGVVRKQIKNESALTTRQALCRQKGKKLKQGKVKKVKVSSALRQKIGKVIEEKKIHGRWLQKSYAYIPITSDGSQFVGYPNYQVGKEDYSEEWNFLPQDILHIVSVLFNSKADSQSSRGIGDLNNLGNSGSNLEGQPTNTAVAGNNAKFHVKKSWVDYLLKNNTQNSLKVLAYTVASKQAQSYKGTTTTSTAGGAIVGQYGGVQSPTQYWVSCLATQVGFNPTGATVGLVGMRPEKHPLWTKMYKHEVCEMIIEPGQSVNFKVQGPHDMDMDFQKFWLDSQFMDIQKFTRGVFFIVENDLVQGKETLYTSVGRFKAGGAAGSGDTKALLIEKTMGLSVSIPESAGAKVGSAFVANAQLEMNMRRNVFGHKVYLTNVPASIVKIDEEQPATAI